MKCIKLFEISFSVKLGDGEETNHVRQIGAWDLEQAQEKIKKEFLGINPQFEIKFKVNL